MPPLLDLHASLVAAFTRSGALPIVAVALFSVLFVAYVAPGRARSGSVLARSRLARTCLVGAFAAAWAGAVAIASYDDGIVGVTGLAVGLVGAASITALLLVDVARIARVVRSTRGLVPATAGSVSAREPVDLGVGKELWVSGGAAHRTYRGAEEGHAVFGSARVARRRLAGVLVVDLAMLAGWVGFAPAALTSPGMGDANATVPVAEPRGEGRSNDAERLVADASGPDSPRR